MCNIKNRGSEWHKWDLHLHSCFTWLDNKFPSDDTGLKKEDEFIKSIKDNDLSVVGLTNYFNFKDEDFELKEKLEKEGIITFLNLEIRLSNVNKSDQLIDYHIIFDNKLNNKIIKNLLGELKAQIGATKKSFNLLTKTEIENKANISIEILQGVLEDNPALKGKYLTGFLSRGHGSATSEKVAKTNTVYESVSSASNLVIHSSCNDSQNCKSKDCKHNNLKIDRDYWLNKSPYKRPLLQTSDSHKLSEIGTKFSWIKSELTFEGLRQIMYEPEDRISLQTDNPDMKSDYQVIDYIEFSDSKKLFLNSSLNTIIGGRSSGKSTLTNTIASTLKNKNFIPISEDKNRGMHTLSEDLIIHWRNGQTHQDIEFLPQDYMIQIAEDDNLRNDLIKDTVKSSKNNYSKITLFESELGAQQNKINNLVQEWSTLKEKLLNLSKPEGDKEGIEIELKKLKELIEDQDKKNNFSKQESQKYSEAYEKSLKYIDINKLAEINIESLNNIKKDEILLNVQPITLVDRLLNKELTDYIEILKEEINKKWQNKITELELKQLKIKHNSDIELHEIEESEIFKKGKDNISNNKTLKNLTTRYKDEIDRLEEFKKYENLKIDLQDKIIKIQTNLIRHHMHCEELRNNLQTEFKVKATPVEIKLNFQSIKFEDKISYLRGNSRNTVDFIETFNSNSTNKIEDIFNNLNLTYNQGKTQEDLIKDVLSQQWFTINYILQYEGDNFEHMSQGKKSFVILSLILEFSNDKKPVIIDQPEDSLDNRAIYNDLTTYLKAKKKERQIILVTHNPNIVVGADAENVIVANQHSRNSPNPLDQKFYYINGALENTFINKDSSCILNTQGIREHVIELLEGGSNAFKKREEKYNNIDII